LRCATKTVAELLGLDAPKDFDGANQGADNQAGAKIAIPAEMIAASFSNVVRAVKSEEYREYLLKGGRGSTKSSYASLEIVAQLVNNPTWHALVLRDKSNTLRRSVYNQISWAIAELGLSDKFKKTTNPLEMTYISTGQKIYFGGAKDPDSIKGIKLEFGYIALGWFEELDQFAGAEAVRKIEQSFMRGGNDFTIFKTYNPPKSANNWVNLYSKVPKDGQYIHDSDYRNVPVGWLGQPFIDEAEHLKKINPKAYRHEYLGEIVGIGGQVLENVEIREITDKEIEGFDNVLHGLDFGWFPDPTHYTQMYYHAPSLTLYIFGEVREWKTRNRAMYEKIVKYGYNEQDLIIGDNTPPQNIADYRAYGANIRGAEKGAGSRKYRRRWMQSLVAIVVDPVRCPYTAEELPALEYTQTKDGEFISEIPDENDHAFDAAGYGTNLIWRRKGQ